MKERRSGDITDISSEGDIYTVQIEEAGSSKLSGKTVTVNGMLATR
jgi:predicted RNA-binding protein with TRAM domain